MLGSVTLEVFALSEILVLVARQEMPPRAGARLRPP